MENFFLNYINSIFGTGFLIVFYIIQIRKTIKTKSVEGVSMLGWAMLNLALLCLLANAIAIYLKFGTWGYLVTELANVGLAIIEFVLIMKYRKKKPKKVKGCCKVEIKEV